MLVQVELLKPALFIRREVGRVFDGRLSTNRLCHHSPGFNSNLRRKSTFLFKNYVVPLQPDFPAQEFGSPHPHELEEVFLAQVERRERIPVAYELHY